MQALQHSQGMERPRIFLYGAGGEEVRLRPREVFFYKVTQSKLVMGVPVLFVYRPDSLCKASVTGYSGKIPVFKNLANLSYSLERPADSGSFKNPGFTGYFG